MWSWKQPRWDGGVSVPALQVSPIAHSKDPNLQLFCLDSLYSFYKFMALAHTEPVLHAFHQEI